MDVVFPTSTLTSFHRLRTCGNHLDPVLETKAQNESSQLFRTILLVY